MKYAIADYLPVEARQTAAKAAYSTRTKSNGHITAEGFCPLGVATYAAFPLDANDRMSRAPEAAEIALFLASEHPHYYELSDQEYDTYRDAIESTASVFISDWDAGRITDLAEALGVQS